MDRAQSILSHNPVVSHSESVEKKYYASAATKCKKLFKRKYQVKITRSSPLVSFKKTPLVDYVLLI